MLLFGPGFHANALVSRAHVHYLFMTLDISIIIIITKYIHVKLGKDGDPIVFTSSEND